MINKIKDFLKKMRKQKASDDFSDQDELMQDDAVENSQTISRSHLSKEDKTNEISVVGLNLNSDEDEISSYETTGMKSKISHFFSSLKNKFSNIELKNFSFAALSTKGDGSSILSPSLSRAVEKLLSRSAREPIHQVSLVLLICSITYSLGKVSALLVRGTPILDSSKDYTVSIKLDDDFNPASLVQVKSINIFRTNSGMASGKKNNIADKKCDKPEQTSNLPIKLMNTVVLQDSVKSIASVQVSGNRELQELRVGDDISTLARIFKITRLEILVKNLDSGMCESISSDSKSISTGSPISVMSPAQSRDFKANKKISGIDNVGNKFSISKTLLDEKLKDIAAVLTQARALKIQNPDGSLAFKMTELDPQGIFPYLGIQDQDIITSINGKPIYDMNEVMLLFGRIKGLDNLSLGIKREGSDSVQEYSIKK